MAIPFNVRSGLYVMDKREMLKLAAKAIGLDISGADWSGERYGFYRFHKDRFSYWNPLANKSQLHDLMYGLKMRVDFRHQFVLAGDAGNEIVVVWPIDEPDAAHAIIRVAAEVGKRIS